jgi:hypothetical protein
MAHNIKKKKKKVVSVSVYIDGSPMDIHTTANSK